MSPPLPSPSSLRCLARAAVSRTLHHWPAGRRMTEDLEQEAIVAALESLRTWDSTRAAWTTWAWWAMKSALRNFLLRNIGPVSQPDSKRVGTSAPRALGFPVSESLAALSPPTDARAMAALALSAVIRGASDALRLAHRSSTLHLSFASFVARDVEISARFVAFDEPVSELASRFGLSRQGVYDSLRRLADWFS